MNKDILSLLRQNKLLIILLYQLLQLSQFDKKHYTELIF